MTSKQRSILVLALVTQGLSVGLTYGIFPVFLVPLETLFDAPRTQIAAGQILIMTALTAGSISAGAVLDKGYARNVLLGGALLLSGSLALASVAPNLIVLAIAAIGMGFAVPSVGPLAGATLITRNFDAERGRAMGLMSMGPPMGSGLLAALAGWTVISYGVRTSFLIFAVLAAVVMVPLIAWIVPARFPQKAEDSDEPALAMGDVIRMPVFWWTASVFALGAGVSTGWTVHIAAFFGESGLDETQRAGLLAAVFWMGVPGALFFGYLSDRVSLERLYTFMLGGQAVGYLLFSMVLPPAAVVAVGIALGFMTGGMIPLFLVFLGKRMGPEAFGRAMGLSNLLMLPVMAVSVVIAARFFEAQGNYVGALRIFAVMVLFAIVCVFGSKRSAEASALAKGTEAV
ncbi:MAG: MFS transporter [Myxococcota bacterium]